MLTISRLIADSIVSEIELAGRIGQESRLVCPGLSETISQEIHHCLMAKGINAYWLLVMALNRARKRSLSGQLG